MKYLSYGWSMKEVESFPDDYKDTISLLRNKGYSDDVIKMILAYIMAMLKMVQGMKSPKLNTNKDLVDVLQLLRKGNGITLSASIKSTENKVKLISKDVLATLIYQYILWNYESFEVAEEMSDVNSFWGVDEAVGKADAMSQKMIDNWQQKFHFEEELMKDMAGYTYNGEGWIPLLGFVSKQIIKALKENDVPFTMAMIYDILQPYHNRSKNTDKDKSRAIRHWQESYKKTGRIGSIKAVYSSYYAAALSFLKNTNLSI